MSTRDLFLADILRHVDELAKDAERCREDHERLTGDIETLRGYVVRYREFRQAPVKRLQVPWLSQLGTDAGFAPGDCGPACLAMWLGNLGHFVTVDEVSRHTQLNRGFRYTMPAHLIWAARNWSVDLYWRRYLELDDLKAEIDAERPCIVLVNYSSLPDRYDPKYPDGHWLLVHGYGDGDIVYSDPYYPNTRNELGKGIAVKEQDFYDAWNRNHLNGNSDRQALRMR